MFFLYCNESANSMLTAVNSFLRYMEHPDCFVWQLKVPRTAYCSQDKKLKLEEYKRLVAAAEKNRIQQLFLLLQTICDTGVQVSQAEQTTL